MEKISCWLPNKSWLQTHIQIKVIAFVEFGEGEDFFIIFLMCVKEMESERIFIIFPMKFE